MQWWSVWRWRSNQAGKTDWYSARLCVQIAAKLCATCDTSEREKELQLLFMSCYIAKYNTQDTSIYIPIQYKNLSYFVHYLLVKVLSTLLDTQQ